MSSQRFSPDLHMTAQFYRAIVNNNHDELRALLATLDRREGFIGRPKLGMIEETKQQSFPRLTWAKDAVEDCTEAWKKLVKDRRSLDNLDENEWAFAGVWLPDR